MNKWVNKKRFKLNAVQILVLGFATVILIGAILLTLPISSRDGTITNFLDSLFTSTSAVCVTGLVTLDTGTHWNAFGKTVIIALIQVGGLGFMTFATLLALIMGKRITLRERLVMQEALNTANIQGIVKLVKYVLTFTFLVEFIGAILLATQFVPKYGFFKGICYGAFHSISAFCNAGFDLMGNFTSVTSYAENTVVILTISSLIVIGGLGFSVWWELYDKKSFKKLSLHSKVVITTTSILIIGGAVLMFMVEFTNEATMANMSFKGKVLSSIFASISPRTAGFNSISTADMSLAGRLLTIILMFIGGSPGSTAGGIKTTTLGLLVMTLICTIRGKEDTEMFKKRVNKDIIYKAFTIATLGVIIVAVFTMTLSITEANASFEYLLYEVTSAFGTVGLTLGLTPNLSSIGKCIIALAMYLGRVGALTVVVAITNSKKAVGVKYPEDKILVG